MPSTVKNVTLNCSEEYESRLGSLRGKNHPKPLYKSDNFIGKSTVGPARFLTATLETAKLEVLCMKSLDGFNIRVDIPVAWGDMDSFNHVNNTKFFKYFETARIKYFEKIGFIETMERSSIGPILASTSAKFIKPLFYPDTVTVGTRVTSIEPTQFIMEYIIESKLKGIVALGESKMVVYDYKSSKRTSLPDTVRSMIREIDSI